MLGRADLLRIAAVLSLGAAVVHVANVEEHLAEWWGYGLFFLFASIAQLYLAFALWWVLRSGPGDDRAPTTEDEGFFLLSLPRRTWFLMGVAGNGAIIVLYAVTRTIGIPFLGPAAGEVEPLTALSVLSKACEIGVVACLALLLRAPALARAPSRTARS